MLIFIALPYSHGNSNVVQWRVDVMTDYMAHLFSQGKHAVAPVAIGHPLTQTVHRLPADYSFWRDLSRKMLPVCTEVHVLTLPGWAQSEGVRDEIYHAYFDLKLPVKYIEIDETQWVSGYTEYIDITHEIDGIEKKE